MARLMRKHPKYQIGELVCLARNGNKIGVIEAVRTVIPNNPTYDQIRVGWETGPSSWHRGLDLWEPQSVISLEVKKLNDLMAAHERASRRQPGH